MKTISIDPNNIERSRIRQVASVLLKGGVVALPTETVYGLAGRADNKATVAKLYSIKNRSQNKPFSVAIGTPVKALNSYLSILPPFGYRLLEQFWPGPLTVVYYTPDDKRIGIRVPDHPVTCAVLNAANVSVYLPSANISGQKEALSAGEVEAAFGGNIDLIVDAGPCQHARASTVIDLTYYPFKILRQGVVSEEKVVEHFTRKRILFVCTGNTCRSPMAQLLLQSYLRRLSPYAGQRYQVLSRGISALNGSRISSHVADILKDKESIEAAGFSSQRLDRKILLSSDLIFTMEKAQSEYILRFAPSCEGRLFNLKKFLPPELERDIADPIGRSHDVYEQIYGTLRQAMLELIEWL